jgi:hypothetical protein
MSNGDGPSNSFESIAQAREQLVEMLEQLSDPRFQDRIEIIFTPERVAAVAEVALAALDAATDTMCTLDGKDPVPIHTRPRGPNGDLIMFCEHDPSHCWSFTGSRIECP